MPKTMKLPLVGQVPKSAVLMGGGAAVIVTGYLIYKHSKDATASATGGATGYGYGVGGLPYNTFYGYGSNYAPSGVTPYPTGSEYGYGAYGYGDYNPYTGQYLGPGGNPAPPTTPTPTPAPHEKGKWVTIHNIKYYFNPNKDTLGHWVGTGKKRHWVKTPV